MRPLILTALGWLACLSASAQSVVSVHSGVVNFSEGQVYIDDQAVNQKFGQFPSVKVGSELATGSGRAEILLMPGAFLRLGENSAFKMVSNDLADTRIEFLNGTLILDSTGTTETVPVKISYKDREFRFPKNGVFRLDSDPGQLKVFSGEAEVVAGGKPVTVAGSHSVSLASPLMSREFLNSKGDALDAWSRERDQTVIAGNSSTQAPDALDPNDPAQSAGIGDLSSLLGAYSANSVDPYSPVAPYIPATPYAAINPYVPLSPYIPLTGMYAGYIPSLLLTSPRIYGYGTGRLGPGSTYTLPPLRPHVYVPGPIYRTPLPSITIPHASAPHPGGTVHGGHPVGRR